MPEDEAMKTATLDELKQGGELLKHSEPILLTEEGQTVAVVYSLAEPEKLPMDVRREVFLEFSSWLGRELDARGISEEEILRDFAEFRKRRRGR
jgi:hypothetical protein